MSTGPDEAVSDSVARLLDGCAATCHLWPDQEEGPYRRGEQPRRRDVTEGRVSAPLALGLRLGTDNGDPLVDAEVEMWHCDAIGRYSGYPPPNPLEQPPRGYRRHRPRLPRLAPLPVEAHHRVGRDPIDKSGRETMGHRCKLRHIGVSSTPRRYVVDAPCGDLRYP